MWFWFSLIALLFWSGSDLFSKIGCRDKNDRYSHLKMVMACMPCTVFSSAG